MKRPLSSLCALFFSGLFLLAVAHTTPQGGKTSEQEATPQGDPSKGAPSESGFNDFDLLGSADDLQVDPFIETLDHPLDIFIYSLSAFVKKHRNNKFNPAAETALARSYRTIIDEIFSNPIYQDDAHIKSLKKEFDETWSDVQNIVQEDQEPRQSFFDFGPPSLNEKNILKLQKRFARAEETQKKVQARLTTFVAKDPFHQRKLDDLRRITQYMRSIALIGKNLAKELYQPFLRSKQLMWGAGSVASTLATSFILYHMFKKEPKPPKLTNNDITISEKSYVHPYFPLLRDVYKEATNCYSVPLHSLIGNNPSEETIKRFLSIAHIYANSQESDKNPAFTAFITNLFKKDYQRSTRKEKTYEGKQVITDEHGKPVKDKDGKENLPSVIIPWHDRVLATGRPLCYNDSLQVYRIGDLSQDQVEKFGAIHHYYINDYTGECIASELAIGGSLAAQLKKKTAKDGTTVEEDDATRHERIKKMFGIQKNEAENNSQIHTKVYEILSSLEREEFFKALGRETNDTVNTDEVNANKETIHQRVSKALEDQGKVLKWADEYLKKDNNELKSLRESLFQKLTLFKEHLPRTNDYYKELVWWAMLHTVPVEKVQSLVNKDCYHDTVKNTYQTLGISYDSDNKPQSRLQSRKALAIMHNLFLKDPKAMKTEAGNAFAENLKKALGNEKTSLKISSIIDAMILSWAEEAVATWEKGGNHDNPLYKALEEVLKSKDSVEETTKEIINVLNQNISLIKPGIPGEKKILYVKAYAQKLMNYAQTRIIPQDKDKEDLLKNIQKSTSPTTFPTREALAKLINELGFNDDAQPIKELITWAQIKEKQLSNFDTLHKELLEPQLHEQAMLRVKIIEKYGSDGAKGIAKKYIDAYKKRSIAPADIADEAAKVVNELPGHQVASFEELYTQEKAAVIKKIIDKEWPKAKDKVTGLSDENLVASIDKIITEIAPDAKARFDELYASDKNASLRTMITRYGTLKAKQAAREAGRNLAAWVETDPEAEAHKKEFHIFESLYKDAKKTWKRLNEASILEAVNESCEVCD